MRVQQVPVGRMQNFAYVLSDSDGEAVVVDPAWDVPAILARCEGLRVRRILATHGHGDHVNGVAEAKRATGALVCSHESADHPVDVHLRDDESFRVGALEVRALHVPGHRFDSMLFVVDGTHLLTGDTLFVGDCGRVDLPGSDPRAMHDSLLRVVRGLPDELIVLPGHDYGKTPTSTIGREKRENATLQPRPLDAFVAFMAE